MCPLKTVYHHSHQTGECLWNTYLFCCWWSEGAPGGSDVLIHRCSDPLLSGARCPWATEKQQVPEIQEQRNPPGNLKRQKLSDQIKSTCSAGESRNIKTRMLSPQGGKYASPGVKSACGFNHLAHATAAHMRLFGWHHWPSHPGPGAGAWAGEDHGLPLSSSLPSLTQLMTTGPGGQRGRMLATSSESPLAGKGVILFSSCPLLIPWLVLPPRAIPHKTSLSLGNTTL